MLIDATHTMIHVAIVLISAVVVQSNKGCVLPKPPTDPDWEHVSLSLKPRWWRRWQCHFKFQFVDAQRLVWCFQSAERAWWSDRLLSLVEHDWGIGWRVLCRPNCERTRVGCRPIFPVKTDEMLCFLNWRYNSYCHFLQSVNIARTAILLH